MGMKRIPELLLLMAILFLTNWIFCNNFDADELQRIGSCGGGMAVYGVIMEALKNGKSP